MTNKINGIDASECRYLNKVVNEEPYCNADEEHLYTCSSDENCYFKQHERLKEENVKLLFDKGTLIEFCNKLTKIIDEKKENEVELYEKNVRLQEENEGLKSLNDFNVQKIEVLQEENEKLKDRNANLKLNLATYDLPEVKKVLTDWRTGELQLQENKLKKYKQALEEIRKEANRLLYELNPIYGYNNSNHFELLAKYVLAKTKEVLNDRD